MISPNAMTHHSHSSQAKLTANIKAAGCAAKIGARDLSEIVRVLPSLTCPDLLAGIENFEDAAVYRLTEDLAVVQTIDFFPPVLDDPYLYGRVAAANAMSDVYAMGGRPILALNVFCFPTCDYPLEVAQLILKGGADVVAEAGAALAGGHSIQAAEPIYGLAVTGIVHPARMLTNGGARAGDAVVLCKPIGTGIALLGLRGGVLTEPAQKALLSSITALNNKSLEVALKYEIHAATDVTGFGLIGHLHELGKASQLAARLWARRVPLLPEALKLAEQGFVPAAAYANRQSYESCVSFREEIELAVSDLLFDPQTSGGLMFSLPAAQAPALVNDLQELGLAAGCIASLRSGLAGLVEVANNETED